MKGIFGESTPSFCPEENSLKIPWGKTSVVPIQEPNSFLIWMREADMTYYPTSHQENYFRIGFFPYKIGTGIVLGNAYRVKIPIPGQYVYEQIDQFRPGLMLQVSNATEKAKGSAYVSIIQNQSTDFFEIAANTNSQNLETPYNQRGGNQGTVLAVFQANFSSKRNNHVFSFSPYVLIENSSQSVEFYNDATSNLCTLGIYADYTYPSLELNFEWAHNFGTQHVKRWDRNQFLRGTTNYNTHLFYVPNTAIPLDHVTTADFTFSPYSIFPFLAALNYGNGTVFEYPSENGTFIFKNSYDRFRKAYDNDYRGFFAYADCLITMRKPFQLGFAFAYASGDDDPNDTNDTILMTRLIPGIHYKDYNKKCGAFVGIEQLFEGKSINPLYFAQAQKIRQAFTNPLFLTTPQFSSQGFFGATLRYTSLQDAPRKICVQGTFVTYFLTGQTLKGISASLAQSESLVFTQQMSIDIDTRLPQKLGNELNFSLDYKIGQDFTASLLGAIFFPGNFYNIVHGREINLELQAQLNAPNFTTSQEVNAPTIGKSTCFFISAALTCLFDFADIKNIFNKE